MLLDARVLRKFKPVFLFHSKLSRRLGGLIWDKADAKELPGRELSFLSRELVV